MPFVEAQCAAFYADGVGRPSLAPGRYFRLLLGYFEGLDSGTGDRVARRRLAEHPRVSGLRAARGPARPLDAVAHPAPDRPRDAPGRVHVGVAASGRRPTCLVQGHTIGIDATTLEANAAMRSIVRRDTGEGYDAWLTRLAEASGIATPTRAELARFDRTRKKKGSNDDWTNPHDPDAKIHEDEGRADASGPYCRARGRPGDWGPLWA